MTETNQQMIDFSLLFPQPQQQPQQPQQQLNKLNDLTQTKKRKRCGWCREYGHHIGNCDANGVEQERVRRREKKTNNLLKLEEKTRFDIIGKDMIRMIFLGGYLGLRDLIMFGSAYPKFQKILKLALYTLNASQINPWKFKQFPAFINQLKTGKKCVKCLGKIGNHQFFDFYVERCLSNSGRINEICEGFDSAKICEKCMIKDKMICLTSYETQFNNDMEKALRQMISKFIFYGIVFQNKYAKHWGTYATYALKQDMQYIRNVLNDRVTLNEKYSREKKAIKNWYLEYFKVDVENFK